MPTSESIESKGHAPMSLEIVIQGTPNPNARKFILNRDVYTKGKVGYSNPEETNLPLAKEILWIPGITNVHFFENVITITKSAGQNWDLITDQVSLVIRQRMDSHDPNFNVESYKNAPVLEGDLKVIDEILSRTVRPGLQADGGDLQILAYEDNVLTIAYEGACGSCPSSAAGTLNAIEGILQNEFNPNIVVKTSEEFHE